jgi:hypothetical protein
LVIQLHRSKIAVRERKVADWKILIIQGRNEHSLHDWLSHDLVFTKTDDEPISLTPVGSAAGAPAPLLRPSPATYYHAEILVDKLYLWAIIREHTPICSPQQG